MFEKGVVVGRGDDVNEAVHLMVAEAAELGANDFVSAGSIGREMHCNNHPGDSILLQAQFAHEKIVDHVLRTKQQFDLPIDRDG